MQNHNHGQPRPNKIPLENGSFAEFYRLLSFDKETSLSVFNCFDDVMKEKGLFPFAMTESGNYICIKGNAVVLYSYQYNEKNIYAPLYLNFSKISHKHI